MWCVGLDGTGTWGRVGWMWDVGWDRYVGVVHGVGWGLGTSSG